MAQLEPTPVYGFEAAGVNRTLCFGVVFAIRLPSDNSCRTSPSGTSSEVCTGRGEKPISLVSLGIRRRQRELGPERVAPTKAHEMDGQILTEEQRGTLQRLRERHEREQDRRGRRRSCEVWRLRTIFPDFKGIGLERVVNSMSTGW
jgi:hypothetical protein